MYSKQQISNAKALLSELEAVSNEVLMSEPSVFDILLKKAFLTDRHYQYSDDTSVYKRGKLECDGLIAVIKKNQELDLRQKDLLLELFSNSEKAQANELYQKLPETRLLRIESEVRKDPIASLLIKGYTLDHAQALHEVELQARNLPGMRGTYLVDSSHQWVLACRKLVADHGLLPPQMTLHSQLDTLCRTVKAIKTWSDRLSELDTKDVSERVLIKTVEQDGVRYLLYGIALYRGDSKDDVQLNTIVRL